MLLCDCAAYRVLLRRQSLSELMALYERTLPDYAALARMIAEELSVRLGSV